MPTAFAAAPAFAAGNSKDDVDLSANVKVGETPQIKAFISPDSNIHPGATQHLTVAFELPEGAQDVTYAWKFQKRNSGDWKSVGDNASYFDFVADLENTDGYYKVTISYKLNNTQHTVDSSRFEQRTVERQTNGDYHSLFRWVIDSDPTCTVAGSGHYQCTRNPMPTWDSSSQTIAYIPCPYRGDEQAIPALGHEWSTTEWTSDASGHWHACKRANDATKDADGNGYETHDFGDWTITQQPTCTEKGSKTRSCTTCNYTDTQIYTI